MAIPYARKSQSLNCELRRGAFVPSDPSFHDFADLTEVLLLGDGAIAVGVPVTQHAARGNRAGISTHPLQHATTVDIFPRNLPALNASNDSEASPAVMETLQTFCASNDLP